jgi:hypothetical protein
VSAPTQPKPLQNIGGAIAQPFVLRSGFTENPTPPSSDFYCAAVSSVLGADGVSHKSYRWLLRSEKVRALRRMAAQKLASVRREDAKAVQEHTKAEQATLRVLFDVKKHRQAFYKF